MLAALFIMQDASPRMAGAVDVTAGAVEASIAARSVCTMSVMAVTTAVAPVPMCTGTLAQCLRQCHRLKLSPLIVSLIVKVRSMTMLNLKRLSQCACNVQVPTAR